MKITDEKVWTVIFEADLFAYAFVEVSLSDTKFMRGEYLMQGDSLRFAVVNLLVFVPLFNTQKSMS